MEYSVVCQSVSMREEEKEEFLNMFQEEGEKTSSLLGFCVLGGIFSEVDKKRQPDRYSYYRDRLAYGLYRTGDFETIF